MKKEITEINAPAIDLIADILDKHVDAILEEVRSRFKQIKADQSIEADRQTRNCGQCVPLSTDGTAVFIDGVGEVPLDFSGQARGEPVGEVFTMEPLDGSGDIRCHALLSKRLPAGTKPYAAPQPQPQAGEAVLPGRVCGYTPGQSRVEIQMPSGTAMTGLLELGSEVFISAAPQPQQIPYGYKLVPVEPTREMVRAGWLIPLTGGDEIMADCDPDIEKIYRAMLEAAPQQPTGEQAK